MTETNHNLLEYTVSEVAGAIKRTVEDNFGYVRVRGEISGWRGAHGSGHAYFRLKDDKAVLEAVCWKGSLGKLSCKPEEGLEVIASGRITTYPGSSKYQIVIEKMELAGAGALMALLEKRKAQFAAEGLFDAQRKKELPFMPRSIGVVTSPTGAVIRDILHRLEERFPVHVMVWPVAVQGENAAQQIAAAIRGFNALPIVDTLRSPQGEPLEGEWSEGGTPPLNKNTINRPDLLIVARGGGSLEDLWAFNEEIVVRAAADSSIPLISAVGHETDTTLIDFVSDRRAPTPTAAAEIAVPVRAEWLVGISDFTTRMFAAMIRLLEQRRAHVEATSRGVPQPQRILEFATQRIDDWNDRLAASLPQMLEIKLKNLQLAAASLRPTSLTRDVEQHAQSMSILYERLQNQCSRMLEKKADGLMSLARMLESVSINSVLARGFAIVRNNSGVVTSSKKLENEEPIQILFHDGIVGAKTN